jgi:pSer/pThr/pTyr-binding forkhead associated (FHA) protein
VAAATAPSPAAAAPHGAEAAGAALPPGAQPRLLVLRGQKRNVEYPVYEGLNFIGRADEKPVDIDLEEQEPPDRIWCSRQHACISFEDNVLHVEDLNSANGTYVNRTRVYPGQKRPLSVNDIIQIGNVQLKVIA